MQYLSRNTAILCCYSGLEQRDGSKIPLSPPFTHSLHKTNVLPCIFKGLSDHKLNMESKLLIINSIQWLLSRTRVFVAGESFSGKVVCSRSQVMVISRSIAAR